MAATCLTKVEKGPTKGWGSKWYLKETARGIPTPLEVKMDRDSAI